MEPPGSAVAGFIRNGNGGNGFWENRRPKGCRGTGYGVHRAWLYVIVYALSWFRCGGKACLFSHLSLLTSHLSPLKINAQSKGYTTRLAHRLIVVGVVGVFIQQVVETVVVAQVEHHISDTDTG